MNEEFSETMLTFLKSFNVQVTNTDMANGKDLFYSIMKEKQRLLEEMLSIGNLDGKRYNALVYSYQKDKTLFDRKINKAKEGK